MNQTQLQELISAFYTKLPLTTQGVFSQMKWLEKLKAISQSYNLSSQQIESLGTETTLALLGIIHLDEYKETLTKELELSKESTDKMLAEIDASIFTSIRPELHDAYQANLALIESETEDNDDIPLPPYAKPTAPVIRETIVPDIHEPLPHEGPMTKSEKGVLSSAGIEMLDSDRSTDIIAHKLSKATASTQATSDYTLPKMSAERPSVDSLSKKKADPYHEEI